MKKGAFFFKAMVCKDYKEGGLCIKMIDVYSFLANMKISWLRRINFVESGSKTFILNIYYDLSNLTAIGSE